MIYLVYSPNGQEAVAFTDKNDALYAATGRRGYNLGVSCLAASFREINDAEAYEEFKMVEVDID